MLARMVQCSRKFLKNTVERSRRRRGEQPCVTPRAAAASVCLTYKGIVADMRCCVSAWAEAIGSLIEVWLTSCGSPKQEVAQLKASPALREPP
jgi:hypothetical protein